MDWGNPSRQRREGRRTWWQRMLCALLALAAFAPLPAAAQQGQSYAIVQAEIRDSALVVNNADMYFGVITPGTTNGTVTMTADDTSTAAATCTVTSGITRIGPCRAARFEGSLPFIYNLQITKPAGNQITLVGPTGATMRVRDFTFVKGTPWMLGGSATNPNYTVIFGNFIVFVGATLEVARNQRAGVYNGSFTLSFNYN